MTEQTWLEQLNALEAMRVSALTAAIARLDEIDIERAKIVATFPQLKKRNAGRGVMAADPKLLFDAYGADGRRKRRLHTPEYRAEIVERIRAGAYVTDIAQAEDLGNTVVRRWCERAGVTPVPMPRGTAIDARRAAKSAAPGTIYKHSDGSTRTTKIPPDTVAAGIAAINAGKSIRQIMSEFSVSDSTVRRWRNVAGGAAPAKRSGAWKEYSDDDRATAVGRVAEGEYTPDVERDMGITAGLLKQWCAKAGIPVPQMTQQERIARRRQGGAFGETAKAKPTDVDVFARKARGLELLKAGKPYREVAKLLGVDPSTACKWRVQIKKGKKQ